MIAEVAITEPASGYPVLALRNNSVYWVQDMLKTPNLIPLELHLAISELWFG